jgi:hypothetical protein
VSLGRYPAIVPLLLNSRQARDGCPLWRAICACDITKRHGVPFPRDRYLDLYSRGCRTRFGRARAFGDLRDTLPDISDEERQLRRADYPHKGRAGKRDANTATSGRVVPAIVALFPTTGTAARERVGYPVNGPAPRPKLAEGTMFGSDEAGELNLVPLGLANTCSVSPKTGVHGRAGGQT